MNIIAPVSNRDTRQRSAARAARAFARSSIFFSFDGLAPKFFAKSVFQETDLDSTTPPDRWTQINIYVNNFMDYLWFQCSVLSKASSAPQ
jgi:hypothetical protein